jgi:hypothetical protein
LRIMSFELPPASRIGRSRHECAHL